MIETPADYRSFVFCTANKLRSVRKLGFPEFCFLHGKQINFKNILGVPQKGQAIRYIFCYTAFHKRIPLLSFTQTLLNKNFIYLCNINPTFAQTVQLMKSPIIAPSLLAADFANLQRDIEMINHSQADWFHIDIMDGVFVPNISFGMPVLEAITKHTKKPVDVHLMIIDPDRYIKTFADLGTNVLTVHYEACTHLHRTLQAIKAEGMQAGVALNPHTPVAVLDDIITDIDVVCLMSVNPGFGGQHFIENTYAKIEKLKDLISTKNASTLIEVDGGVTDKNAKLLMQAGADVLVAGNFVFKSENPIQTIADLKKQKI